MIHLEELIFTSITRVLYRVAAAAASAQWEMYTVAYWNRINLAVFI